MLELNKIYCGDCLDLMKEIDDKSIDLVVTSPPYDNLRDYKGYTFNFESIAQELFKVIKCGGIVVWVVGDATIDGSETGTSFKQALYFKKIGFNLHDTMIWIKTGQGAVGSNLSYWQNFEYMFIFTKGKIKTFNPINDRKNSETGNSLTTGARDTTGYYNGVRKIYRTPVGRRFNTWKINTETNAFHKAIFPEQLAHDHIISWSNEGDVILDPMCGSGTTCKMALKTNRSFIGIDISEEYCNIARKRLEALPNTKLQDWFE